MEKARSVGTLSITHDGKGLKMPILAVIGIDLEGKREVLGFNVGDREKQQAWEALLTDLKNRGLETVDLWITDSGRLQSKSRRRKDFISPLLP